MRHTILKLAVLMLALTLALTGCNLIQVDPIMQLDEDMANLQKKYSAVVASYDGGEVTQADVMAQFTSQLNYMSQLYSMYGMNLTNSVVEDVKQSTLENAIQNIAVGKEFEKRALTLSDEAQANVESTVNEAYQEAYDSFYGSATGKEDVRAKHAEFDLYNIGYTKEALTAMQTAQAQYDQLETTLEDEITEVTDEELQAAYDEEVADDEAAYADSPSAFESAMSSDSGIVAWMPEGYRTVKHILVKPADDVLSAVTDAHSALNTAESTLATLLAELETASAPAEEAEAEEAEAGAEDAEAETAEAEEPAEPARTVEDIQADIDAKKAEIETLKADAVTAEEACLASVKDKLDEIYGKIEAGEDFASLIETYGEDPGMQNEPTKTRGYYVCANSTTWDQNFKEGAMALANVGDVSETPVISTSGVHIIRYESDVTPGAVALDEIRDTLYEDTLETMKHEHFHTELESWVSALNPQYNVSAFVVE